MSNKPKYESITTTASTGYKVDIVPCTIGDITYTIPAPVAKYIKSLQEDRNRFVEYREMTHEEMAAFVNDRAREIITALNGTSYAYNSKKCFLWKQVDVTGATGDFDTMNMLTDLIRRVVFNVANKPAGSDINDDGLTREV